MLDSGGTKIQKVEIPFKIQDELIDNCDKRHRLIVGGRGKGASWSIARILLSDGMSEPMFIPCVREVQKTIKYSVKKLLDDTIDKLGWRWFYNSTDQEIKGLNGSLFAFFGIHDHTAENIKSLEDAKRCWVAEAQSLSRRSVNILRPTIRGDGATIWWDLNPRFPTDPVYMDYIKHDDPHAKVCYINWPDNPWFTEALRMEKDSDYARNELEANHIWKGELRDEGELYVCPSYLVDLAVENELNDLVGEWAVGADIAHQGGDGIVFWKRCGNRTVDRYKTHKQDAPETTRDLFAFMGRPDMKLNIDNGHIGAAVADFLERPPYDCTNVNRINFGGTAMDEEHYYDTVTEMYFTMRDKFPYIDIPDDDELYNQLTQRQYKYINGRRGYEVMKIESKKEFATHSTGIKSKSPDDADACTLCFYDIETEGVVENLGYSIF